MESNESRMIGPPGCGKTTWLGQRVDDAVETGRRLLVTSLTKSAAAEINARNLPSASTPWEPCTATATTCWDSPR